MYLYTYIYIAYFPLHRLLPLLFLLLILLLLLLLSAPPGLYCLRVLTHEEWPRNYGEREKHEGILDANIAEGNFRRSIHYIGNNLPWVYSARVSYS